MRNSSDSNHNSVGKAEIDLTGSRKPRTLGTMAELFHTAGEASGSSVSLQYWAARYERRGKGGAESVDHNAFACA